MGQRSLGILLALAVSGAAAAEWTLGPDGFGPMRIGMTFEEAREVAGPALQPTDPALLASEECDQVPLPGRPGVALMFVGGVLHRIDVFRPGVRTAAGVGPGDPVAKVEQAYPGLARMPNRYDGSEEYLTVGPRQGRALRFETLKGKVDRAYAGDWEQVQYVEGCL